MIVVKSISFGGDEYNRAVQLRQLVLRTPLGLIFKKEDLESEHNQYHIVAIEAEKVIGVLILMPLENGIIKMRQVAVDPTRAGNGVGKNLVIFAEEYALEKGFLLMVLNARISAKGFYLNLNYKPIGEEFLEVGIPHIKMEKKLS